MVLGVREEPLPHQRHSSPVAPASSKLAPASSSSVGVEESRSATSSPFTVRRKALRPRPRPVRQSVRRLGAEQDRRHSSPHAGPPRPTPQPWHQRRLFCSAMPKRLFHQISAVPTGVQSFADRFGKRRRYDVGTPPIAQWRCNLVRATPFLPAGLELR